jgi:hypothetical protein
MAYNLNIKVLCLVGEIRSVNVRSLKAEILLTLKA